jgi:hypothetical protein
MVAYSWKSGGTASQSHGIAIPWLWARAKTPIIKCLDAQRKQFGAKKQRY